MPAEMHPTETRSALLQSRPAAGAYPNVEFDFLVLLPAASGHASVTERWLADTRRRSACCTALKAMRATIRDLNIRRMTQVSLADIAQKLNPLLRGWIAYYGRYTPSALYRPVPVSQFDDIGLGAAKVQALQGAQSSVPSAFLRKAGTSAPRPLRALAARHDRRVCLMGAQ